jgi:hypothetical protein
MLTATTTVYAAGATIITELTELGPNRIYIANDCGGQQWILRSALRQLMITALAAGIVFLVGRVVGVAA